MIVLCPRLAAGAMAKFQYTELDDRATSGGSSSSSSYDCEVVHITPQSGGAALSQPRGSTPGAEEDGEADGAQLNFDLIGRDIPQFVDVDLEETFLANYFRAACVWHMGGWVAMAVVRIGWLVAYALPSGAYAGAVFIPLHLAAIAGRHVLHRMADERRARHLGCTAWIIACVSNGAFSVGLAVNAPDLLVTPAERKGDAITVAALAVCALIAGLLNGSHGLWVCEKHLLTTFFIGTCAMYKAFSDCSGFLFGECLVCWFVGSFAAQVGESHMRQRFIDALRAARRLPRPGLLPPPPPRGQHAKPCVCTREALQQVSRAYTSAQQVAEKRKAALGFSSLSDLVVVVPERSGSTLVC